MTDLADACADLEHWLPALAAALARDNTPAQGGHVLSAGGVVNLDVLHAMITLTAEIPAATAAAATLCGETWRPRPLPVCLRQLPRFHQRLNDCQLPGAAKELAADVGHWTTITKFALGLRQPDQPIGFDCPLHPDEPFPLVAVGAEGFLTASRAVIWQHAGLIVCRACSAEWPATQWLHLGKLLTA